MLTVAGPGFPQGGGVNPLGDVPTYDFAKFSQKNCTKLKEFGPRGARPKFYYVDPPLEPNSDCINYN